MDELFHSTGKLRLFIRFGGIELYFCTKISQAFAKKYATNRFSGRKVTHLKWEWSNKTVKISPNDIRSVSLIHTLISTAISITFQASHKLTRLLGRFI